MSDTPTSLVSEVENLQEKTNRLEEQRKILLVRKESIEEEIQTLLGEVDSESERRDVIFFEKGKDKYKDVRLIDLVIQGEAKTTIVYNDMFQFTLRNLSKGESLELDRYIRKLSNEPRVYIESMMRVAILSKILVSYGEVDKAIATPDGFDESIEAIKGINEKIFDKIWTDYIEFAKWIECGLRTQLKNC